MYLQLVGWVFSWFVLWCGSGCVFGVLVLFGCLDGLVEFKLCVVCVDFDVFWNWWVCVF